MQNAVASPSSLTSPFDFGFLEGSNLNLLNSPIQVFSQFGSYSINQFYSQAANGLTSGQTTYYSAIMWNLGSAPTNFIGYNVPAASINFINYDLTPAIEIKVPKN